jgi:hypothetical protein
MKNYGLTNKGDNKNIIHKTSAESEELAIIYFSKVKKLKKSAIVDIFDIVELPSQEPQNVKTQL